MLYARGLRLLRRRGFPLSEHCLAASSLVTPAASPVKAKIYNVMDSYEEFIGIKAVKLAQAEVMAWEERLSQAQLRRREQQAELKTLQSRIKEIHFDLDRTSRGEDKYLHLLTEEHATIKKERSLMHTFEALENDEREAFHQLSTKVRESHERERERAEKTKWWGVTASLIGATIGILGSSIGNELRMRRLQEMLPAGSVQLSELAGLLKQQHSAIDAFIKDIGTSLQIDTNPIVAATKENGEKTDTTLQEVRAENGKLLEQMKKLADLVRLQSSVADPEAVVYVGSEMEHLLEQTERNLESKMKLQTLLSVVLVYSALGLAIPIAWALFRGG